MFVDAFCGDVVCNTAPNKPLQFPGTDRQGLNCVVAIPVRDEAERLTSCLVALANQRDKFGQAVAKYRYGVVVFANNCSDGSAELATAIGRDLSLRLFVVEASLPASDAHAGGARRAAMEIAEQWLNFEGVEDGAILTTDADSQVGHLWIANNLAALGAGVDAVLGNIRLDQEGAKLPDALHRRGRLESRYESLLTETSALIDPIADDPWPHHSTISGASLAVTRRAYAQIGGMPSVPLGEDKALVAALQRIDARIRHADDVVVITSGRCHGRAAGGVADTLRLRSVDPAAVCDPALEPYRVAFRRAKWRQRLRPLWHSHDRFASGLWRQALQMSLEGVERAVAASTFGAAWEEIERHSRRLDRRLIFPSELLREISVAERILKRLRDWPKTT